LLEGAAVPGVGLGGAADVEVRELVQQGLQHVAGADAGIGRDLEPELAGDGEAEPVWLAARAAHLQRRGRRRQRAAGEHRQSPQALQLLVEGDAGDEVVGARARARRRSRARGPAAAAPQPWQRGHQ
jgi:hypothetical protein